MRVQYLLTVALTTLNWRRLSSSGGFIAKFSETGCQMVDLWLSKLLTSLQNMIIFSVYPLWATVQLEINTEYQSIIGLGELISLNSRHEEERMSEGR